MIKFKISMLVPFLQDNQMLFLRTVLTNYLDQVNIHRERNNENELISASHIEYTYNEKFSEEENSQKTLTFSMNRSIITENNIYENPFTNLLHIGSLLLLEDKYDNCHLFYIKDIKYNLNEFNSTYDFTCQDAFSYLLTKQRNGYTIENDASTSDFIGALDIDEWTKKIVHDCYINYTYIPLEIGLYEAEYGALKTFSADQSNLNEVHKIVKEPFDKIEYKSLYTTFPFSGSGSAGSILIDLASELGMHLKVAEKIDTVDIALQDEDLKTLLDNDSKVLLTADAVQLYKYFWFEPAKNTSRLDLTYYTPRSSIQNFGFSHKGDSLTTVLNIQGPIINDEEITLFPKVSDFFIRLFGYEEYWNNTKYYAGMFTHLCKQATYIGTTDTTSQEAFSYVIENGEDGLVVKVHWTPKENPFQLYDYINFHILTSDDKTLYSEIRYLDRQNQIITQTPETSEWYIKIQAKEKEPLIIRENVDKIPDIVRNWESLSDTCDFEIHIKNIIGQVTDSKIYLGFSRNPSNEDLEFATVADSCPWLENKIIDLQYFYSQNIITKAEYSQIMDIFKNQLRIINGQLMLYAQEYYNALHYQTTQLAKITADLDTLGASIQHTFIDGYKDKKAAIDLDSFTKAYDTVFATSATNLTNLLNYNKIKADYLNNFFDAQQRFFKNIKNFKDYFNSPINNTPVYKYTITWTNLENNQNIYTSDTKWSAWYANDSVPTWIYNNDINSATYGKNFFDLYHTIGKNKEKINIADKSMLGNLYKLNTNTTPVEVTTDELYRPDFTYFKKVTVGGVDSYTKLSWEEILKNYISNHAGTYKYKELFPKQTISLPEGSKINNLANSFFTYFTKEALFGLVDSSAVTDKNKNKFYDAFLPISVYYKTIGNTEYEFDAVTPNNESSYYRYTKPISSAGSLTGYILGGLTLGWSWLLAWTAIQQVANMFGQTLKQKGESNYTLTGNEIKEYEILGRDEISNLDKNDDPTNILDSWCDSTKPFYNTTSQRPDFSVTSEVDKWDQYATVGFTPQTAAQLNMQYDANGLKLIKENNKMRYTGTYVIVPFKTAWLKQDKTVEGIFTNEIVTDVLIHPLMINSITIPDEAWKVFKNSDGTKKELVTLSEMIEATEGVFEFVDGSDYLLTSTKENWPTGWYAFVCEICDYKLEPIRVVEVDHKLPNFDVNLPWYDENCLVVNPKQLNDLTYGLYRNPDAYTLIEENEFSLNNQYYIFNIDTNTYDAVYGILYPFTNPTTEYSYRADNIVTFIYPDKNHTNFTFTVQGQDTQSNLISAIDLSLEFVEGTASQSIGSYDFLSFSLNCDKQAPVANLNTNGAFWLYYHIYQDNPIFHERAAMIEAQLTEYWSLAYNASKYCDYFIPESWLPGEEGITNNFSALLYNIEDSYDITLLPTLIPDVEIYSQNGTTTFKKYRYTLDSNNESATNSIAPIQDMFIDIQEKSKDWYQIENGKTVYYYNANPETGYTWSQFLKRCFGYSYPRISGLYKMEFDILKEKYIDYPLTQYEQKKQAQHDLWQKIYNNYNFLILENNYENTTATSSTDLLKLARYAFKDYNKPEAEYNIEVIDIASLSNYDGSEIKIGDGIRINAQEYYNSYDALYKDLSQFLFVTSIKYDLRKATDISLGVNAIKYQDKLIDKLIQYIH